jgi:nucleoside-diphosphate-sugar epimerase
VSAARCSARPSLPVTVTAVVRNPSKLPADVDVVRQDLATPDADVLAAAMRDVDAVISAVGPHRAAQAGIVAPATAAITHAMGGAGVRRLVVISASPVGVVPSTHRPEPPRYDPGDDLLMRYLLSPLIRRTFGRVHIKVAHLMLTVLRQPETICHAVGVAY